MKTAVFFLSVFLISFSTFGQEQVYKKVKIELNNNTLQEIGKLGLAPEGKIEKGKSLIGEYSVLDLKKMGEAGISYQILVEDVKKMYVERNVSFQPKTNGKIEKYATPNHFRLGSVGGFLSLDQLMDELDSMYFYFPDLITPRQAIDTFKTTQGRNIFYVKISDNPNLNENEPEVMYASLTHAREPMGMQQLIFYMWYLLENYNSDPEIKYLVDNTQIYFAPCVNPDGYRYNQQTDPNGGGMWRKNRRKVNNYDYGIDLNRNYGYQWGFDNIGSSPEPSSMTYRGTGPFSEPETQAMKWFVENHNIQLILDYHTYSDVLLYPWGYIDQVCEDSVLYKTYSAILTKTNGFAYGTANQCIGYNANGGSFDWFYGEQETKNKIIAWGPEAGNADDGFWPSMNRIETIAKNYMDQNLWLVRLALDYTILQDDGEKYLGDRTGYFKFNLQKLGMLSEASCTVSLTGISTNVVETGEPVTVGNIDLLGFKTDSISYQLINQMDFGDSIIFLISIDNGKFIRNDTVVKIFGIPIYVLVDSCNSFQNWSGHDWGISDMEYYSGFSSITDSPNGDYNSNSNKQIVLSQYIDIPEGISAELSFWAKWDLENDYDYVQFFVSSNNGGSWNLMESPNMNPGSIHQAQGQPLYDGNQSIWVNEVFDMSDYMGQSIKFKFVLISDGSIEADGFYFDDFVVKVLEYNPYNHVEMNEKTAFTIFPNPTNETLNVCMDSGMIDKEFNFIIYNQLGQECIVLNHKYSICSIPVKDLAEGIYFVSIHTDSQTFKYKFIKN